jgi:hypothetical protein
MAQSLESNDLIIPEEVDDDFDHEDDQTDEQLSLSQS